MQHLREVFIPKREYFRILPECCLTRCVALAGKPFYSSWEEVQVGGSDRRRILRPPNPSIDVAGFNLHPSQP